MTYCCNKDVVGQSAAYVYILLVMALPGLLVNAEQLLLHAIEEQIMCEYYL